ncbi:MAG: hypothetical protein FGM32_06065 [Candidatus Kapabacteria bacterium]|nr:hypothetical protein [Candidatus Kapabacteria bacterium]
MLTEIELWVAFNRIDCPVAEVPNYRSTELQKYPITEVPNYRSTELQKYRITEVPNYRSTSVIQFFGNSRKRALSQYSAANLRSS